MNDHHQKINKVRKHTFAPAIIEAISIITRKTEPINLSNTNATQTQPQYSSLHIENLDQKVNKEDLYELFGLKSTKYLSENSYIVIMILS